MVRMEKESFIFQNGIPLMPINELARKAGLNELWIDGAGSRMGLVLWRHCSRRPMDGWTIVCPTPGRSPNGGLG